MARRRSLPFIGAAPAFDLALLAARLTLAVTFFQHGAQKLFGWYGGPGIDGTAEGFASVGLEPERPLAILAGSTEFGGALLLAVGLLTPLAAIGLLVTMVVAVIVVTGELGFLGPGGQGGGFETNFILGGLALVVLLAGPGRISVDRRLGLVRASER
ncbi:MAG: DoxX family protein [Solirubrobacteraceae bacterium]